MRRRTQILLALVLVSGVCATLAFPVSQFVFLGRLQGEAFYNGKPTSYWAAALSGDRLIEEQYIGKTLREAGPAAVPVLAELLKHESTHVQRLALMFLDKSETDISACVPALVEHLASLEDSAEFQKGIGILRRIDDFQARELLIRCMHPPSRPQTREAAVSAALAFGPVDAEVLAALESCLDDRAMGVRVAAAGRLLELKRRHPRLPEVCLESLRVANGAPVVSWRDVTQEYHDEVLPRLFELLRSEDPTTRRNSTAALGWAHVEPADVPAILEALNNDDPHVRVTAAQRLAFLGLQAEPAVEALIQVLKLDTDENVRLAAIGALGRFGATARQAIPVLTAELQSNQFSRRLTVISALLSIDSENRLALAAVSRLLARPRTLSSSGMYDQRQAVLSILVSLGKSARGAVPALLHALDEPGFRVHVASALAQIGGHDDKLLVVLIELLRSKDFDRIEHSCTVLQIMGPAAKLAVPELTRSATKPRTDVRRTASAYLMRESFTEGDLRMLCAGTLWSVEPQNPLPAKILVGGLQDERADVRYAAATAITSLGPKAQELAPILAQALSKEREPTTQIRLREAIASLKP
jgi:HEAT repeat protein